LTSEQQKEKAKNYIEESEIVPDLRSNPLMLALMCNIYRGENYIPQNRPDVYEKCTTMLFERWDKGRGIHVSLPFEAIIKPAMMYLAHWIYANESLQGGVTERDLIIKATDYLCGRRFEDRDEAERAAREFIEFCRGRAWVFTDTGTTKTGEKLYQFTHRTFLEYFTASHLVRIYPTPDRLGKMLLPKIALREWDIVAQLAFQIQNKNVEGAGDELLMMLIDPINHETDKIKWNMVSFAGRCLEFLIPIPKVTRSITSASIDMLFDKILK
jgi:predicted NACHT family NTPase